ncbi:MAG: glycosyltransferase [Mycoplasma sp.]
MKKILICTGFSSINTGGTETYLKELISIAEKIGCDVHEFSSCKYNPTQNNYDNGKEMFFLFESNHKVGNTIKGLSKKLLNFSMKTWTPIENIIQRFMWNKSIKILDKKNNYDLIIYNLNVQSGVKKLSKKSISIQHTNFVWIKNYLNVNKFKKIAYNLLSLNSHFIYNKKIVVFSESDRELWTEYFKNKDYYISPVFADIPSFELPQPISNKKKITYLGRFCNEIKNSELLISLFENNGIDLLFVSDNIPEEIFLNKYKHIEFICPKDKSEISEILQKRSSYLINISNFEGMPLSLVEGLILGIPVIVRNSFSSAKSLISNGESGVMLPFEFDEKSYIEIIQKAINTNFDIKQIKLNSLKFSRKEFDERWTSIIEPLLN